MQTPDPLGAAAPLGPDAQAAVVALDKWGGSPHGKAARRVEGLFGAPPSRVGSAHNVVQGAIPLGAGL